MSKDKPKRELLFSVTAKDCTFEAMRTSKGAGGQKRDKTSSAIRCTHNASGATGFSQDHREQSKNKREAFVRMAQSEKFKLWHRITVSDMLGRPTVDQVVDDMMRPENIKIETKQSGKWHKVDDVNESE